MQALPTSFPLPLRLERTAPFRAITLAPFVFISAPLGRILVEEGFDTDYASVPRGLWNLYPPDGDYTPAAVIHDALYWHQATAEHGGRRVTRAEADRCFLEAMEDLGIPLLRRRILYTAVRLGGGRAWENNARHKAGLPPLEHGGVVRRLRNPRLRSLVGALLVAGLALGLGGCATTRLEVTTPEGLRVRASFPKNLRAEKLRLVVAGHTLSAESIQTDAATVIGAQAEAITATGEAVGNAATAAAPLLP